ncbi:hypothetical protein BY996DRAFT_6473067 [Phakopsora pachyrhizi]|nr:hypothetical protein BY996DRAFT_6473067 [Phakopsora pachyrhizi]
MSLNTNQDMFSGSALSNNEKYTSFAQVLQPVSSDELDYLVPENSPAVLWRLVCQSKLNNPMSLTPDERDYCKTCSDVVHPAHRRVNDLQGYWQMESWKIHQSKTNHDQ